MANGSSAASSADSGTRIDDGSGADALPLISTSSPTSRDRLLLLFLNFQGDEVTEEDIDEPIDDNRIASCSIKTSEREDPCFAVEDILDEVVVDDALPLVFVVIIVVVAAVINVDVVGGVTDDRRLLCPDALPSSDLSTASEIS